MMPGARIAAAGLLLAALGCARSEHGPEARALRPREIESPAPPGSAECNLAARDGRVYSSWLAGSEGAEAFQYAVFERGKWSAPRTIASGDGFFATFDGPARAIRCALAVQGGSVRRVICCGNPALRLSIPPIPTESFWLRDPAWQYGNCESARSVPSPAWTRPPGCFPSSALAAWS